MTAERREAVSPNLAGGAENPATVPQQTTDLTPDPADGPPTASASPADAAAPPAAFGRYQVRRALGAGGFGAVYLGHDSQLDRPVAIKVLHAGSATSQAEGERFLQEARRLAQLRHPGIVAVHDVGVQEGQLYIVSDYLDGPDLGQWLRDNRPAWPEAARIAAAVADALAHAHARLIVHRDVKPANIILTADRAPVLVDFGLALDEVRAGGDEKGIISGTPWYMSPEQADGHGPPHRRPHRHLQPGRGALRDAHRPRAVPGDRIPGAAAAGARRRAAAPSAARPRHPARAGDGPASRRWRSGSRTATPPRRISPRTCAAFSRRRPRRRPPGRCRWSLRRVSRTRQRRPHPGQTP